MAELKEHYAAPNLIERIDQALAAVRKSPDSLQLADLTPIDEFHLRGPGTARFTVEPWLEPRRFRLFSFAELVDRTDPAYSGMGA